MLFKRFECTSYLVYIVASNRVLVNSLHIIYATVCLGEGQLKQYNLLWFIPGVAVYTGRETKVRDSAL